MLRVFERLRISLTQFIGADGFTALMRRSLALARSEVPSLQTAKQINNRLSRSYYDCGAGFSQLWRTLPVCRGGSLLAGISLT